MAINDARSQRLFIDAPMDDGRLIPVGAAQAHYLINVLRVRKGDWLQVFNGRDGEWGAEITEIGKRSVALRLGARLRTQIDGPDVVYVFAPLKHARLDYMVQKATELGVAALLPVLTQRTVPDRVNVERMRANVIEAAEQCGILRVPTIHEPVRFDALMSGWDVARTLVFCDEGKDGGSPLDVLFAIPHGPLAVLIGPEGGFSPDERQVLQSKPFVRRISLGPRVMRADTAAVAALTLINATLGDWR